METALARIRALLASLATPIAPPGLAIALSRIQRNATRQAARSQARAAVGSSGAGIVSRPFPGRGRLTGAPRG